MTENFPPDTRYAKVIAVENNILSPRSLNAVRLSKVSWGFFFRLIAILLCFQLGFFLPFELSENIANILLLLKFFI